MTNSNKSDFQDVPAWREHGVWRIAVAPKWDCAELLELLCATAERPDAVLLQQGRERVVKVACEVSGVSRDVVVKTYRAPGKLREFFEDAEKGSKAFRAFKAAWILAQNGVGTPEVIAVAERREGGHLLESRLITLFVPELSNFRDELFRIFKETPDCEVLMTLMLSVASACRTFHDCGILHRDLGNQNIALKKNELGAWDVLFLDLDRVRIAPAGTVSDEQRGADLARLDMPSDLLRVFHSMYYEGYGAPGSFYEGEAKARKAFERHSALRPWRHPIREWRVRREDRRIAASAPAGSLIPLGKELWIWDGRSEQAIPAYMSKDRRKFRSAGHIFTIAKEFLRRGRAIWKNYETLKTQSFSEPVDFSGAIGMSIESDAKTWEMQLRFLEELEQAAGAKLPILMRIYHHKGKAHWTEAVAHAQALHERGNAVALALVQDRAAIRDAASWREMVLLAVEKTQHFADFYEIGHATNRGKWGVWDLTDYAKLVVPAIEAKKKYPKIKLTGPACIDFDLHTLPGLLSGIPAGTFSALSQHLYVDRRGAPENFQGKFDTVGKCAIHRAIAKAYGFAEEKIIISEANWPLLGAGVYGPIDSPFVMYGPWDTRPEAPWTIEPPRVSEEDYAKFMCRYFLLTLASGHVSRVYWWRLLHRGFGLVDDSDVENPRARPAFLALKKLLATLAGARFEHRLSDVPEGTYALEFVRPDGSRFTLRWTLDSFPEIV